MAEPTRPGHKQPEVTAFTFIEGPTIAPTQPMLAWLENELTDPGPRRLVSFPVTIRFRSPQQLGIERVFLGSPEEHFELTLDDTTMGIPLLDRLASVCSEEHHECTVWLVGYWGRPVEPEIAPAASAPESERQPQPFTVRQVQNFWSPHKDPNPRILMEPHIVYER